jgi:hypothetical protein
MPEEISSLEGLIDSAAGVLNGEIAINEIRFAEDFICKIRINGERYDGYIDSSIASFIVEVEKSAKRLIRKYSTEETLQERNDITKNIHVKAKVGEGSSIVELLFDNSFGQALANMQSEHILYALFGLMGLLLGNKVLNTFSEIKNKAKDEETKLRIAEHANKMLENSLDFAKPILDLVGRMQKDDTISFPEMDKPLTKKEAKEEFKVLEATKVDTIYIDDEYEITEVSLDKIYVILRKGVRFSASTKLLNSQSRQALFNAVKDAGVKESTAVMNLQVTLSVEGLKKEFFVTAIGEKREGAISLKELSARYAEDFLKDSLQQGSLLDMDK